MIWNSNIGPTTPAPPPAPIPAGSTIITISANKDGNGLNFATEATADGHGGIVPGTLHEFTLGTPTIPPPSSPHDRGVMGEPVTPTGGGARAAVQQTQLATLAQVGSLDFEATAMQATYDALTKHRDDGLVTLAPGG